MKTAMPCCKSSKSPDSRRTEVHLAAGQQIRFFRRLWFCSFYFRQSRVRNQWQLHYPYFEQVPGPMKCFVHLPIVAVLLSLVLGGVASAADWLTYEGKDGPGRGKHIVLLSGDEEYRSEQALPMLARILAVRHGFKCTVLFPINPADGTIDPVTLTNLPGMSALDSADLCIMSLRFRELPD